MMGELQQRGTIISQHPGRDGTGLEMGPSSRDASVSLCGSGQKQGLVRVHECVIVCLPVPGV